MSAVIKPPDWKLLKKSHILARGMIGCWPAREGQGIILHDRSGNARDGEFTGSLSWSSNNHGATILGAGGHIEIDTINDLFNPIRGSVIARADSNWSQSTARFLWYFLNTAPPDNIDFYRSNNVAKWRFRGNDQSKSVEKSMAGITGYHTVGMTWDTDADEMKAYWDGMQEGSTQTGLTAWSDIPDSSDLMGALHSGEEYGWTNNIEYCYLYDRVLSQVEMKILQSSPYPFF